MKNLCLAGGVALNCVGNGRILREGPFDDIWIQPAAGDAGGALGVAHCSSGTSCSTSPRRRAERPTARPGRCSARSYSDDEIRAFLDTIGAGLPGVPNGRASCATHRGRISSPGNEWSAGSRGAWSSGRGRSAARSIIGDARSHAMQSIDEPEDQVPRVVPPVRAVGPEGARARVLRDAAAGGQPVHAARRARAGFAAHAHRTGSDAGAARHRQAEGGAVQHPGGDARRLFGAGPDGRSRAARPLLRA